MKKAISLLSLILCLVMAFSLVACGGSDTTSSEDKDDTSSTASTTSSTGSTTASTESTTSDTSSTTSSVPEASEIEAVAYMITEGNESAVYVIAHKGEQIVGMSEGIGYTPEEGKTFTQEEKDDFKAEIEEAFSDLDANFASYEMFLEDGELSVLITFTGLDTDAGLDYYLENTDIPEEVFFKGVTFTQLNQSFIDNGFTEIEE